MIPRRRSLRAQLLALLLAASLLPAAVAVTVVFYRARSLMQKDAAALLAARAEELRAEIDAFHRAHLATVDRITHFPQVRALASREPPGDELRGGAEALLDTFTATDPNIRAVSVVGLDGRVVLSTERRAGGVSVAHRAYFKEAARGATVVSDVFLSLPVPVASPVVAYAAPLKADGEEIAAVVVLAVEAKEFWDTVRAANGRAGPGSFSVLFDRHGIRIAHSFSDAELFRPAGPLPAEVVDHLAREQRFGSNTKKLLESPASNPEAFARVTGADPSPGEAFTGYAPSNGLINLGVMRRLTTAPWTLFCYVPVASVEGPVRDLVGATALAAVLVSLLALGFGLVASGRVVRPIRAMSEAVAAVGRGENVRLAMARRDELGVLGRGLDDMAAAVAASRENLETRVRDRTADLEGLNEELRAQKEELMAQREELRAQQRQLELQNQEVERANRLKSEFLTNMSHELRTPLNSIIGFSQIIRDELEKLPPAEVRKYLDDVAGSGRHLLSIINDILDLSKIEADRVEMVIEDVDPHAAIADVVGLIRPQAHKKTIGIEVRVNASRWVRADPARLRQVLLNLLSNAVKFSAPGAFVEVGATLRGEVVDIHVKDSGPGIEDALRPRLFQPFVQGEAAITKRHEGTGLGLAISKRLCEQQGGSIEVESAVGRGSTFVVSLPAAAAAPPPVEARPGRSLVLLLDEEPASSRRIRQGLEQAGYAVAEVDNGHDAVEMAKRLQPAAVILDPAAERRDAFGIIDTLARGPETRDIPVIASRVPTNTGFLPKPLDAGRLLGHLVRSLDVRAQGQAPIVLAIDDDPRVGRVLAAALEPAGYRLVTAAGGREGLAKARAEKPDLVIVDIVMPDLSGFEVVEALGADESTRGIPILVLTASDLTDEQRRRLRSRVRALGEKGDVSAAELVAAVGRVLRARVGAESAQAGPLVLVVDDNDMNRALARTIVERMGYRVIEARGGQEGIDMARREKPALVLMDLAMPGMDGLAATRVLRGRDDTAGIPIVALTALAMRGDEERARTSGIDEYVTKPVDRAVLEAAIRRQLGKRNGAHPLK